MCRWACWAWLRVGLLSQSKAFQLYGGSFGNVNNLWKLNFNLWLVFTHHTWKRNANEHQCKKQGKKKLCFWRLTRAKQLWQENYIKTQVVALRCCCSQCEPISSRLQTSGYELKCFFDFQCSAIGAAETLPALSAVSHWKEWVRNTAFQWTCNTLMLNGKKTQKKTTLRIHRRFELLHPDEFHLVVVLTAMNQKMGP